MSTPIQPRNFQLVPNAPVKVISRQVIVDDDDVQPPIARSLARAFADSLLFVTDEVNDKNRVDGGR